MTEETARGEWAPPKALTYALTERLGNELPPPRPGVHTVEVTKSFYDPARVVQTLERDLVVREYWGFQFQSTAIRDDQTFRSAAGHLSFGVKSIWSQGGYSKGLGLELLLASGEVLWTAAANDMGFNGGRTDYGRAGIEYNDFHVDLSIPKDAFARATHCRVTILGDMFQ